MNKSILMVTFHFWRAKRKAGFHYFAEKFCRMGYNVDFVLFPYSLLSFIKHRDGDRYNLKRLAELIFGKTFKFGNGIIRNFGFPAIIIPPRFEKFNLHIISLITLYIAFFFLIPRLRKNYEFIILESVESIALFHLIKKVFPGVRVIYRQSDPIFLVTNSRIFEKYEERIIKECDLSLFVNEMRLNYSLRNIGTNQINYKILSNGIDIRNWNNLSKPKEYIELSDIALYIGNNPIDWALLFYAASHFSNINFFVVTPAKISQKIILQINNRSNVHFINGVYPEKVAHFIKFCTIGIVPCKKIGLYYELMGMHAKIYQYMYAGKPIVTNNLKLEKKFSGIFESRNKDEFLNNIEKAFKVRKVNYDFDFNEISWTNLSKKMINYIMS